MASRGRPTERREMEMAKEPLQHELTEARRAVSATSPEEEGLLTRTVEDGTLRVLVAFEAFFSDWLPRCLHLDTAELRRKADQRVRARVQGVAGDVASDVNEAAAIRMAVERFPPRVQATTTMPKRMRLSEARKIVGADEATISLRGVDHMGALVNGVLVQKYRNRFHTLSDSQQATLQAAIKIPKRHRPPQRPCGHGVERGAERRRLATSAKESAKRDRSRAWEVPNRHYGWPPPIRALLPRLGCHSDSTGSELTFDQSMVVSSPFGPCGEGPHQ